MQTVIIIVVVLISLYLFFYISGLVFIDKTKKIGEEMGHTKEKEEEYQAAMSEWRRQDEQSRQIDDEM